MARTLLLPCLLAVGCLGSKPAPSTAATSLLATFSPEVIGKAVPVTAVTGDYAMSLELRSSYFVTAELKIDDRRTGVLRLSLAPDGTARACLGSKSTHVQAGQYHYEPDPAKRQHHVSRDARLLALGGRWVLVDGVTRVRFDRERWSTCELADAPKSEKPTAELRCTGLGPTDRVPVGSLACEAVEKSELLDLGFTTSTASRRRSLLLGAPGLHVEVEQDDASQPKITLRAVAVALVESDYRPSK